MKFKCTYPVDTVHEYFFSQNICAPLYQLMKHGRDWCRKSNTLHIHLAQGSQYTSVSLSLK